MILRTVLFTLLLLSPIFSKEISFKEALALLLKNNKELQSKKIDIQHAQAYLSEILANNYGKLSLKETYTRTNHAGHVFNSKLSSRKATFRDFGLASYAGAGSLDVAPNDLNYPNSVDNYETKLVYDLPLFTGFELANAKDIAQLQIKANEYRYKYDEKLLSLELLKAYNAAVAAKEYENAVYKAKEATQAFVAYATALFEEGLVTNIDLKQAKVRDYHTNAKLKEASNKYALSLAYLNFLTGGSNITSVRSFHELSFEQRELQVLQNSALNKREDLSFMDLNTQSLKKSIKIEQSNYYPKIGTHLEYGFNNDNLEKFNSEHDFYLATVGIELKLFDFTREAKIEQKRLQYNKLKLQHEYMKEAVTLEVKENSLNLQAKQDILKEKIKAKELALDILKQSEEMYKNHLIKMTDLLIQEANLQQARAQAIMAQYELTLAQAKLKLSIGKSLKETND